MTVNKIVNAALKTDLLRGEASPHVENAYAERPQYIPDEHMPFVGCEE